MYIGNLASSVSKGNIEEFFKPYGRVRDVVIKGGYGFVEFDR